MLCHPRPGQPDVHPNAMGSMHDLHDDSTRPSVVHLEGEPPVLTIRMDGPARHNVLKSQGWSALAEAFAVISDREDLGCVVVRGTGGRAFSAGSDISAFQAERGTPQEVRAYASAITSALDAITRCPHPTVALVEGVCVGGGLEIAACCDLRVCGRSSRFGAPINRLGLTMSHAELQPLLRLLGHGPVLELLLTGDLIDADRAQSIGFVNRIWPDAAVVSQGLGLAARIASGAPLVNRWHKKFLSRLLEGTPLTAAEQDEAHSSFETSDYQEGQAAFLEKRDPRFRGE